jgi:hypothetical protein
LRRAVRALPEGTRLLTKSFGGGTYPRGFAAIGEPNVAVTRGFERAGRRTSLCVFFPALNSRSITTWLATDFARCSSESRFLESLLAFDDRPHAHHDAVEFPNGKIVLVTALSEGQNATVLQLPVGSQAFNRIEQSRTRAYAHARVVNLAATQIDPQVGPQSPRSEFNAQ